MIIVIIIIIIAIISIIIIVSIIISIIIIITIIIIIIIIEACNFAMRSFLCGGLFFLSRLLLHCFPCLLWLTNGAPSLSVAYIVTVHALKT